MAITTHSQEIFEIVTSFKNEMRRANFDELRTIKQTLYGLNQQFQRQKNNVNDELSETDLAFIDDKIAKLKTIITSQQKYDDAHYNLVEALKVFIDSLIKFNVSFLEFKINFTD